MTLWKYSRPLLLAAALCALMHVPRPASAQSATQEAPPPTPPASSSDSSTSSASSASNSSNSAHTSISSRDSNSSHTVRAPSVSNSSHSSPHSPDIDAPPDTRVFGVLPHDRTVDASAPFRAISPREKFTIAGKHPSTIPCFFSVALLRSGASMPTKIPPSL